MTPDLNDLKIATQATIRGNFGLEAAADACRVGKSVLGDNQSLNRADSFMAIDVAVALERRAERREGWPHVVRAMCAQLDGTFVPLPDVTPDGSCLIALLGTQARESADVATAICGAIALGSDGGKAITDAELDVIEAAARDAIAIEARMLATVQAMRRAR